MLFILMKTLYIIKPNLYKNWHPAISQIDLMEVADQLLSEKGGTYDGWLQKRIT